MPRILLLIDSLLHCSNSSLISAMRVSYFFNSFSMACSCVTNSFFSSPSMSNRVRSAAILSSCSCNSSLYPARSAYCVNNTCLTSPPHNRLIENLSRRAMLMLSEPPPRLPILLAAWSKQCATFVGGWRIMSSPVRRCRVTITLSIEYRLTNNYMTNLCSICKQSSMVMKRSSRAGMPAEQSNLSSNSATNASGVPP